ncbi:hypothetical protein N657DRAFT_642322 [Parathielavia appendiculata]|uniref:Uncharacterized protein n=1 Tax=Parathielavia appendiculata TaxID=2587402 RepID=A0AAN6U5Q5_9PEZI|nr:hypothetical protein N657DRAFT_642322 [Parathielavia appendiculata]
MSVVRKPSIAATGCQLAISTRLPKGDCFQPKRQEARREIGDDDTGDRCSAVLQTRGRRCLNL